MRARILFPALLALALIALSGTASASTLARSGGSYTYTGSDSPNFVTLGAMAGNAMGAFSVTDSETIVMVEQAECTGEGTTSISCNVQPTSIDIHTAGGSDSGGLSVQPGITTPFPITAQTGSGNDSFNVSASFGGSPAATGTLSDSSGHDNLTINLTAVNGMTSFGYGTVNGGDGDDTVASTGTANGDAGNDTLRGSTPGTGSVTLNGGAEDDLFSMQDNAPEIVNGSTGTDTVDYGQSSGVTASLDSLQNDGQAFAQNDNIDADSQVEILKGTTQRDSLTGSTDPDELYGGGENDILNGGSGSDFLDGQAGADVINGGGNGAAGDTVNYSTRSARVFVTNDGLAADDGEVTEGDDVGNDVENVTGGYGDDVLSGNAFANKLVGGVGDDDLQGFDGNDDIDGESGNDVIDGGNQNDGINGGSGNDYLDGSGNNDTLIASSGADVLEGGPGSDVLSGGVGSDKLLSKDGIADTVNCGTGTDHAVRDSAGDTINADCEISDTGSAGFSTGSGETKTAAFAPIAPAAPAGEPAPVPAAAPAAAADAVVTCAISRGRRGAVKVRCRVDGASGKLSAKLVRGRKVLAKTKRNGSGRLTLRAARKARSGRYAVVLSQAGETVARVALRLR